MSVGTTLEPPVSRPRVRRVAPVEKREYTRNNARSGWPLILVVDAETPYRQGLMNHLSREGFQVEGAANAHEGLQTYARVRPDLVLLDAVLPDRSGIELCQKLQSLAPTPVIIVSSSNSEWEAVRALEVGAADYVFKPFRVRELMARMRAILRRVTTHSPEEVLHGGPVILDPKSREVYVSGCTIDLPRKEFELLQLFMAHAGQVVTRKLCIDRIWRGAELSDNRTIDTHVKRIRSKIEPDPSHPRYLITLRGVGFRFET